MCGPTANGHEVAKRIRNSDKADVPIIAMSGSDGKADSELFTFSLQKALNVQAFTDVIKTVENYQKIVQS